MFTREQSLAWQQIIGRTMDKRMSLRERKAWTPAERDRDEVVDLLETAIAAYRLLQAQLAECQHDLEDREVEAK